MLLWCRIILSLACFLFVAGAATVHAEYPSEESCRKQIIDLSALESRFDTSCQQDADCREYGCGTCISKTQNTDKEWGWMYRLVKEGCLPNKQCASNRCYCDSGTCQMQGRVQ